MVGTETPAKDAAADALAARAEAWTNLERAFAKRDYEGMYVAAEALSLAAYTFGRTKKKYEPLMEAKPEPGSMASRTPSGAPLPSAESEGAWTVHELDASLVTFKRDSRIFVVSRPGSNGVGGAVCFCDNRENADLIARALSAQGAT